MNLVFNVANYVFFIKSLAFMGVREQCKKLTECDVKLGDSD